MYVFTKFHAMENLRSVNIFSDRLVTLATMFLQQRIV